MNKTNKIFLGLAGAVLVLALYLFGQYNSFIQKAETVDTAWAQVETQYQRRFDLIPNLVNSVKGNMEQEQEVFGAIAQARTQYAGATTSTEKAEAATQVESALARLLVIMENYPDLRSSEAVQTLMAQLEGTENRVGVERNRYNETVKVYNLSVKQIPGKFYATLFGFSERPYFESVEGSETVPTVAF